MLLKLAMTLSAAPLAPAQSDVQLFNGVAKHLDLGGEFFGFLNIRGDYDRLAQKAEELYQALGPEANLPANLDVKGLLRELGFHNVTAVGASSVLRDRGYKNRAFLAVQGERQGLLKLAGGDPAPFVLPAWAPEKAVAGFEQELSFVAFKDVAEKVGAILEPSLGFNPADKIFGTEMPGIGLTIRAFLTNLSGRITGYAVLVEEQRLPPPMDIPAVDFVVRHDSGDWLFEPLSDFLREQFAGVAVETSGEGFKRLVVRLPDAQSLGFYQPVLHLDTASNHLFIASRPEALADAKNGGPRLAANPRFVAATKELPKEGNQMLWVSGDFFAAYLKAIKGLAGAEAGGPETALQRLLMNLSYSEPQDTASVMVNLPEGLYVESISSESMKRSLAIFALMPIAVLASVATPMVSKTRTRAEEIQTLNEMKNIVVALTMFAGDHGGRYPDALQDLIPDYMNDPVGREAERAWLYLPGLRDSDRATTPIIASPSPIDGRRAVGHLDGSVHHMPEARFQEAWQAARELVVGR